MMAVRGALVALSCVLAGLAQAGEPPPAAAFAALPAIAHPELSPDGRRIALFVPDGAGRALVVREIDRPDQGRELFQSGDVDLEWFSWITDERLVLAVSFPGKRGTTETIETRLLSLSLDGRDVLTLLEPRRAERTAQVGTDVIATMPGDPQHILMNWDPDLSGVYSAYRVNVFDGSVEAVEQGGTKTAGWIADEAGQIRLRIDYDGVHKEVWARDSATGPWRLVTRYDVFQGPSFTPLAFSPDDPDLLYVTSDQDTGLDAVYPFDLRQGRFGPVLFSHPRQDVEGILRRKHDRRIVGYVYTDDRPRTVFTDPAMAARQAMIDAALPGTINRVISESGDGERALVMAASDREPGAVYLYDTQSGALSLIGRRQPALSAVALSPVEPWRYQARDGLEIDAYLTFPAGETRAGARALPLVVLPHGGPATRDFVGFDYMAQFLASRGYAVLQPNYRGSSGYGRAFEAMGFGAWGGAMQDDLADGVRALVAEGVADPARVCIVGGSYGGYAALMGAVREPELFRCAASINGVTDLERFVRGIRDFRFAERRIPRIRDEAKGMAALREASPVTHAARIGVPVLLIHGGADRLVPDDHSRAMAAALRRAGKDHELLVLRGGNHTISRARHRTEVLERLEEFLGAHLGAAPPA